MLDNGYIYLAATRLSAFRSSEDWAMVIEVFGFSPREGLPSTSICTFGSSLRGRRTPEHFMSRKAYDLYVENNPSNEFDAVFPIEPGIWIDEDDPETVKPGTDELILRDEVFQLPAPDDYLRLGVELEDPPRVQVFELCRGLAHLARDKVLASPGERRINVPDQMESVLTLDEWSHPNVVDEAARPSGSDTFRQLARVLVSGDASLYRPSEAPNTHWSHWPEGGTL